MGGQQLYQEVTFFLAQILDFNSNNMNSTILVPERVLSHATGSWHESITDDVFHSK